MLPARAAAVILIAALTSSSLAGAEALRREAGDASRLECVFGKEGASSKVKIKLVSKEAGAEGGVFSGRIWLDGKPIFGQTIKFLFSKTEDGKASLGAGVLTQKRTLYYTELFIELDPEKGAATFEAATAGASVTLQGACTSK